MRAVNLRTARAAFAPQVRIDDTSISSAWFAQSGQPCTDAAQALADAFRAGFSGDVTYEIDADLLRISGADGHGLMLRAD